MIGGTDIILKFKPKNYCPLNAICQILVQYWPQAIVQSGITCIVSNLFDYFHYVPFTTQNEFFIYKDKEAFELWEGFGAQENNKNTMIHLLLSNNSKNITIVCDDPNLPEMKKILDCIFNELSS
jgi:hypothetical protein